MEFETYLSTYRVRLERLAVVLCADHHLAEDVLQDALIRAYSRWDRIGGLEHPHAYVRTIMFNELMSWRRKWGRIEYRSEVELASDTADESLTADNRADLWQAVAQLPPQQRAAVVLRYFEDLPDSEIATVMGCQPVTVRGYIHRALRTLQVELSTPTERGLSAVTHRGRS